MGKVIFILLVLFGLQTKAQNINWCDSIFIYGGLVDDSDSEPIYIEIWNNQVNNLTWMISGYNNDWYDIVFSSDILVIYNYNPSTSLPYDTITICVDYTNAQGISCNCCNSFYSIQNNWSIWWYPVSNVTYIQEVTPKIINNKIYDLSGKEINKPNGVYIKNNKLYYEQ